MVLSTAPSSMISISGVGLGRPPQVMSLPNFLLLVGTLRGDTLSPGRACNVRTIQGEGERVRYTQGKTRKQDSVEDGRW